MGTGVEIHGPAASQSARKAFTVSPAGVRARVRVAAMFCDALIRRTTLGHRSHA